MHKPWMLVRTVGPPRRDKRRILFYRLDEHDCVVPEAIAQAPEGWTVLLQHDGTRWGAQAGLPPLRPWSDFLPDFEAVLDRAAPRAWPTSYSLTMMGAWGIDPKGRPCEFGMLRTDGNELAWVVNYAGWRLLDLNPQRTDAHFAVVGDRRVWLLSDKSPVTAASLPDGRRYGTPPRIERDPSPGAGRRTPRPAPDPTPPKPPPSPKVIDLHLAADQVTWHDEQIEFDHRATGHRVLQLLDSRATFDSLKAALAKESDLQLHVHGVIHPDGLAELQVDPVPDLRDRFELVQRKQLTRVIKNTDEWLPIDDLPEPRKKPSTESDDDDQDGDDDSIRRILDNDEFPLSARGEALERLYEHRRRTERPLVWKGAAILIPLDFQVSTNTVWAWEVYQEDHATYLFAPTTDEQLEAMKAWTGQDDPGRDSLRRSSELKAGTAFLDRALHRGTLEDWWQRVLRIVEEAGGTR
jgi:hypothetical protein